MKTNFAKIAATSLLISLVILLQSSPVCAQQENYKHKNDQQGSRHEKIEAQRVAFITQEVNLTPDEAKVFWPIYNEYNSKRYELKKAFKGVDNLGKEKIDALSDKEASQILDNQIIEAQKFLDLRKEYHAKFRSVLPDIKVLKLYDAEREFQKMLIDKIREHKKSQTPPDKK